MPNDLYPLLFEPVYKDYLWGGDRIWKTFGRPPRDGACAESWEISDRQEGMSIVRNGHLAGSSLADIVGRLGPTLIGRHPRPAGARFPLLVKIIDARERLSVQVHPDERAAAETGGDPKTEMWYVLGATPGARVFAGLQPGVDRNAFSGALAQAKAADLLRTFPVRVGQGIYIPGGRVHAVGEGCFLLEVQQNSNTTYRLYDWSRTDRSGARRPVHLREALQSINWQDTEPVVFEPEVVNPGEGNAWRTVLACPFFQVRRVDLREPAEISNGGESFHALFVASGMAAVEGHGVAEILAAGTSCLLPAGLDRYRLAPETDGTSAVQITL